MNYYIFIILALYGTIIFLGEMLSKYINPFLSRKIAHISCGILTAISPFLVNKQEFILILLALVIIVVITKSLNIFKGIELSEKKNLGTLYFPIGVLLTVFFFWQEDPIILSISSLILALSDPLAAIIGRRYGKKKFIVFDDKSAEGSLTFFIVTFILILVSYLWIKNLNDIEEIKILIALSGSLLITAIEASSFKGTDNILIPLTSAAILSFVI